MALNLSQLLNGHKGLHLANNPHGSQSYLLRSCIAQFSGAFPEMTIDNEELKKYKCKLDFNENVVHTRANQLVGPLFWHKPLLIIFRHLQKDVLRNQFFKRLFRNNLSQVTYKSLYMHPCKDQMVQQLHAPEYISISTILELV